MASSGKWNDLAVRTASAVVIAPIVVVLAWAGGWWFAGLLALTGALLAAEWVRLVYGTDERAQLVLHAVAVVLGVLLLQWGASWFSWTVLGVCWVASIILNAIRRDRPARARLPGAAWFGVLYVSLPVFALMLVRMDDKLGLSALLWLMLLVWSADTVAYAVGRLCGGPKLAPRISPGKTWSGLGGAVLGGAMASGIVGYWLGVSSITMLAGLGGGLAVVAQVGDLFQSHLKRRAGVKDSGKIIPGHGGIFDRVDGLVAVALAALIIGLGRGGGWEHLASNLLNW